MPARKPTPIGQKFHYLTVISDADHKGRRRCVIAECVCGQRKRIVLSDILAGNSKSCGCKCGHLKRKTLREKLGPQFVTSGDIATATIKGRLVVIDADMADAANQYRWYVSHGRYCLTNSIKGRRGLSLHRLVNSDNGQHIDHISGNSLDNRRINLRACRAYENARNSKLREGTSSRYKGVSWDSARGKWHCYINSLGKRTHLGRFENEVDAAKAYDRAAKEIHGEFARINFPDD